MHQQGYLRLCHRLLHLESGGIHLHLRSYRLSKIAKYSWYYLMRNKIESIVHSKYEGEERIHKHRSMMKLSFDSIFYTFVTILAYVLFRNEYWFPTMVGGCGSCSMLYKDYPNWPAGSSSKL